MKYPSYDRKLTLRGNLIEFLGVDITFNESQVFDLAVKQISERNALRESHSMIATALHIASTKPSDIMKAIADVKALLARPDVTQPQLSETRYVLHGDIQPCSVLYSDETTTLLRLDEGDVMCETDTIEWSDSVTYRCQELLKSAADPVHIAVPLKTSKLFAQLVRDERILLNDNGDDAEYPKTVQIKTGGEGYPDIEVVEPEDAYEQYVKCSSSPMTRKEWEQACRPTAPCQPDTPKER